MPQWATFAGFAFVVTTGLLLLSHASRGVLADDAPTAQRERADDGDEADNVEDPSPAAETGSAPTAEDPRISRRPTAADARDAEPAVGTFQRVGPEGDGPRPGGTEETIVLPKSGIEYRVVDAGAVVTAGGITSGIDLALHLLDRAFGGDVAAAVTEELEHNRSDDVAVVG